MQTPLITSFWLCFLSGLVSLSSLAQLTTDPNGTKTLPNLLEECRRAGTSSPTCEKILDSKKKLERATEVLVTEIGLRKYADSIGTLAAIGINRRVVLPLFHTRTFDTALTYEIVPNVYYLNFNIPFPKTWDTKKGSR